MEKRRGEESRRRCVPLPAWPDRPGEGPVEEPPGVGDREDRPEDESRKGAGTAPGVGVEGLQGRLLAEVADEGGQPHHGRARKGGGAQEDGRAATHAGQLPDLPGARGVVDDPDDEEEAGLEQGVRDEHGAAGDGRGPGTGPEEDHEEAQLGDRAEGEQ